MVGNGGYAQARMESKKVGDQKEKYDQDTMQAIEKFKLREQLKLKRKLKENSIKYDTKLKQFVYTDKEDTEIYDPKK